MSWQRRRESGGVGESEGQQWRHGGCDGCTAWGKRGGARRSAGDGGVETVRLEVIGEKRMGEVGGGGSAGGGGDIHTKGVMDRWMS